MREEGREKRMCQRITGKLSAGRPESKRDCIGNLEGRKGANRKDRGREERGRM